ncbi:MAG: glycosyltransferase 87 family protein [Lawsonella sp.]
MSSSSQQREKIINPPIYWDVLVLVGVVLYATLCAFGVATDVVSYRIWGSVTAVAGVVTALGLAFSRGRLRTPFFTFFVAASALVSTIGGIVYRAQAGCTGVAKECGANMETAVVERGGELFLQHGTPYLDIATLAHPQVWHYNPYSPLLSVFGVPRAIFGSHWWTDARWFFLLATLLVLWVAWYMADRPRIPHGAILLLAAAPPVTMNFVAAGIDALIVALMVWAMVAVWRGQSFIGGLIAATAAGMKLTAFPVVVVAAVFAFCRPGRKRSHGPLFVGATLISLVAVYVPAFGINKEAFLENVIRYPLGLSRVTSSAQGGTPGQLISNIGPAGKSVVLGFLVVAVFLIVAWMVWQPPRTITRAYAVSAVGLLTAMLLMPASRFGYLIYPAVLTAAAFTSFCADTVRTPQLRPHPAESTQ